MREFVLATIAYTDQFNYPLTFEEIRLRLLFIKELSDVQLKAILRDFVSKGILIQSGGQYALKFGKENFKTRFQKEKFAAAKQAEINSFLNFVKFIPWVKAVAITGSLAMNVATQDDDVDFMIITQDHRLWLTRVFVVLFAWWKGKRRSWRKEEENSWCFNLWLSESRLAVPKNKRGVYSAYEVCQAKFVFDRDGINEKFLRVNFWAKFILPNYYSHRLKEANKVIQGNFRLDVFVGMFSPVLDLLEGLLYWFQRLYMKPHMTTEVVAKEVAFFHPRDTRSQVMENWKKSLSS